MRTDFGIRAAYCVREPLVCQPGDIAPCDPFEDCRYHPSLCYDAGGEGDAKAVYGISLVDGSTSHCSVRHCGLRKFTVDEAWIWKISGPCGLELDAAARWWR